LDVASDGDVPLNERRAAVALFGYLGHWCHVDEIDRLAARESDAALLGLLHWLRYWLVEEARP
jgi:hypothetical protein